MLHRGKINKVPAIPRSCLLKPMITMGRIEFLLMTGLLTLLRSCCKHRHSCWPWGKQAVSWAVPAASMAPPCAPRVGILWVSGDPPKICTVCGTAVLCHCSFGSFQGFAEVLLVELPRVVMAVGVGNKTGSCRAACHSSHGFPSHLGFSHV